MVRCEEGGTCSAARRDGGGAGHFVCTQVTHEIGPGLSLGAGLCLGFPQNSPTAGDQVGYPPTTVRSGPGVGAAALCLCLISDTVCMGGGGVIIQWRVGQEGTGQANAMEASDGWGSLRQRFRVAAGRRLGVGRTVGFPLSSRMGPS